MDKNKNSFFSFSNVAIGILLFVIFYQARSSTLLHDKVSSLNDLTVKLVNEIPTPRVQYVQQQVFVTSVPQLNSQHQVADSPCLTLKGVETFTDQWGTNVTVDWNIVTFVDSNEAYKNQDNAGIATCYDAYFTVNGNNYHVNRSHRFSKVT